jgi:hypothetical protein
MQREIVGRAPSLLQWRDWGSRYAPVMLGASRHDLQCESDDHGAGQPAARATEGLPNLIPASRQTRWPTSGRGFCEASWSAGFARSVMLHPSSQSFGGGACTLSFSANYPPRRNLVPRQNELYRERHDLDFLGAGGCHFDLHCNLFCNYSASYPSHSAQFYANPIWSLSSSISLESGC